MENDFEEILGKINTAVSKEIDDGKKEESDREARTKLIVTKYDDKFPGLLDFYNNSKTKTKKKKKNSSPKSKAKPKKKDSNIPDIVQNFFDKWCDQYPQLKRSKLEKAYWDCYNSLDFMENEDRINESLLEIQGEFSSIVNRPTGSYQFTPIAISPHSTYDKKEFRQVEGQDYKEEVTVTNHRAAIYGLFHNVEKDIETFGSLMAWDKETAQSISDLRPYYSYEGQLEGYPKAGLYVLTINEEQEFEEISKQDEEEINKKCNDYIKTSEAKIYTVGDLDSYEAPLKTENIIVKGRIQEIRQIKIQKGRSMGGITLSSSEPGSMGRIGVTWFDNAEATTKYAQRSTVFVGVSVSKKKDVTYHNGNWIVPILARPGVKTVAPSQFEG